MTIALGIREWVEIDSDLMAGETPTTVLAERYDVSERTILRRKAHLKRGGLKIRTPSAEDCGAMAGNRDSGRRGEWSFRWPWGSRR